MNITVKRIRELATSTADSLASAFGTEIVPADLTKGSTWVCRHLQKSKFWTEKRILGLIKADKEGHPIMCWVAFIKNKPTAICLLYNEGEDWLLATFLIVETYTQKEQWEIGDAIALRSIEEVLATHNSKGIFHSLFPANGSNADFANRCGFRSEAPSKYVGPLPDPNPMLYWEIGIEELRDNILRLQA